MVAKGKTRVKLRHTLPGRFSKELRQKEKGPEPEFGACAVSSAQ